MVKRHYADRESVKASLGSSGMSAHICWFLAAIFAIIGIVAAATDAAIGLGAMNWFLLAIVTFLASITYFFGMGLAWYLITTDRKKEE
jgi:hypothetical protein